MIELKKLSKSYGKEIIFEDVNLQLLDGSVTCFVGNNGCGKSTLLKVISGLLPKNSGDVICERDYRFAYVPEKFSAVNMTGTKYLDYMSAMDGLYTSAERKDIIKKFTEEFYLTDMINKPMRKLSKGTLQKIGVIQALIRKPEVLLLDEPLSGQDVNSQQVFVSKILELKKQGTIILLAAHEENLINNLSDSVYTIKGRKVIPYEEKLQSFYDIVVKGDGNQKILPDMLKKDDTFIVNTSEKTLSFDIDRLLKEGWHIQNVYEKNNI